MTYASASHPDDLNARNALMDEYRRIRTERTSRPQLAIALGCHRRAISSFEDRRPANPMVASLIKYGEPIGLRPAFTICGLEVATATESAALRACGYVASALIADLVATRKAAGISQTGLADRCDAWSWSAVSDVEIADHEPLLGTIQRYVRALGGHLAAHWEELC